MRSHARRFRCTTSSALSKYVSRLATAAPGGIACALTDHSGAATPQSTTCHDVHRGCHGLWYRLAVFVLLPLIDSHLREKSSRIFLRDCGDAGILSIPVFVIPTYGLIFLPVSSL